MEKIGESESDDSDCKSISEDYSNYSHESLILDSQYSELQINSSIEPDSQF